MSNKIDGISQRPVPAGGSSRSPAAERSGGEDRAAAARGAAGDKVTLTDTARQLQKLADAVQSAPDTDAARVAALKESVERGDYKVDADKVATKLIALERELVGR